MIPEKPVIKQYFAIKEKNPDAVLFFRLGDFYEVFGEDAKVVAPIMNVVLTSRHETPMCGVPAHSVMGYILKLLRAGFKVAVAEQIEFTKKMYEREVVRIYTPSTLIEDELIDEIGDIELVSILKKENHFEVAKVNVSKNIIQSVKTSSMLWIERELNAALEVVTDARTHAELKSLKDKTVYIVSGTSAVDMAYSYIKSIIPSFKPERIYELDLNRFMLLDENTLDGLEIINSPSGKGNSLFDILNFTATKGGASFLKSALKSPLVDRNEILYRQSLVEFFYENIELADRIYSSLKKIASGERIATRIMCMKAAPVDVTNLRDSLAAIIEIKNTLLNSDLIYKAPIEKFIEKFSVEWMYEKIDSIFSKDISNDFEDRIFKEGHSSELDEAFKFSKSSNAILVEIENKYRNELGIPVKIGFNSIHGYYIEVTKSNIDKVPSNYKRIQTLVGAERFVNEEIAEIGSKILLAKENIINIQKTLFKNFLSEFKAYIAVIYEVFDAVYELDFYVTLGKLAYERKYVKPSIISTGLIEIIDGRHPVLDVKLGRSFIPNSLTIDGNNVKAYIITGPNMSGKSTYLRQAATIIVMAQIGSFVPASSAKITPCDRILTRIKTIDYIAKGDSTFMVEMKEVANIIRNMTDRSFIILDEVGRGTSTYDGIAIAMSLIEYLIKFPVRVLFATHFIEISELALKYDCIKNLTVDVREIVKGTKHEVVFLHKVKEGVADKSYGVYVAKLAGLPQEVIIEAENKLKILETVAYDTYKIKRMMEELKMLTPLELAARLEELKDE